MNVRVEVRARSTRCACRCARNHANAHQSIAQLFSANSLFSLNPVSALQEMHTFWPEWIGGSRTLRDSYELFDRLRRAGVRAHAYP